MNARRSKSAIREDILTALSGMEGDPETLVDIEAATAYMYEDQDTNAPCEFWTVLRRYRRKGGSK
jgi:20S proteasome alpha/beta subunit